MHPLQFGCRSGMEDGVWPPADQALATTTGAVVGKTSSEEASVANLSHVELS